ncbi:hypothetical protein FOL46_007363, partial [Perkinsus olseni]
MKSPHAVRLASPSSAVVLARTSRRDRGPGSKEMELVQTIGVLWGEVKKRLIEAEDTIASLKLTIGYLERENAKLHSELEKNHRLKMVSDESCGSAVRKEAGVRREVIDELLERLDSACDKIKDTSYAENGGPSLVRHSDGDEARWDRILWGVGRRPNRPKAWRVSGFSSLPDTAGATWRTREGHMIKNQSFYG